MLRRNFLKASIVAGSGLVFPFIKPRAVTYSTTPLKRGTLHYQAELTIFSLFVTFVASVGASVVAGEIRDWINNLQDSSKNNEANIVKDTYSTMRQWCFINESKSEVSNCHNYMYAYPMIRSDGFNCCAPFIDKTFNKNPFYMEGPTLTGLGIASNDLNTALREDIGLSDKEATEETGEWLIPRAPLSEPSGQYFKGNYSVPAAYETNRGILQINYEQTNTKNVGRVSISIEPFSNVIPPKFEPFEIAYPDRYNSDNCS